MKELISSLYSWCNYNISDGNFIVHFVNITSARTIKTYAGIENDNNFREINSFTALVSIDCTNV